MEVKQEIKFREGGTRCQCPGTMYRNKNDNSYVVYISFLFNSLWQLLVSLFVNICQILLRNKKRGLQA